MSLDGLRAWIGEVERKLRMRTRVFLALAVIAIGIGGAAAYLAVDTRDNAVSESDVQALQEQLEARIGSGAPATGAGTEVAQLEAELAELRTQVQQLGGGEAGIPSEGKSGESGNSPGGSSEGTPSDGQRDEPQPGR
jgi:hypothetical protein